MFIIPARTLSCFQLAVNVNCKRFIAIVQTLENLGVKGTFLHITKETSDKWDGWPSLVLKQSTIRMSRRNPGPVKTLF